MRVFSTPVYGVITKRKRGYCTSKYLSWKIWCHEIRDNPMMFFPPQSFKRGKPPYSRMGDSVRIGWMCRTSKKNRILFHKEVLDV